MRDIAVLAGILETVIDTLEDLKEKVSGFVKCKDCNLQWFQKVLYLIIGSLITGIGYVGVKYIDYIFKVNGK